MSAAGPGGKDRPLIANPAGRGEKDPGSQDGWARYRLGDYDGDIAMLPAMRAGSRRSF